MGYSNCHPHTLCVRFMASLLQSECDFQMDQLESATTSVQHFGTIYNTEGVHISCWNVQWVNIPDTNYTPNVKGI